MAEKKREQQYLNEAKFAIHKVYTKDISFETTHSPEVFEMEWRPIVDIHLNSVADTIGENLYDVALSIMVTVKIGEKTAYLVEVTQAGIFLIDSLPKDIIKRMVFTVCPNILFPFARETVSDIVTRGGFPQLLLSPVNFDALYLQQQQQKDSVNTESKMTH